MDLRPDGERPKSLGTQQTQNITGVLHNVQNIHTYAFMIVLIGRFNPMGQIERLVQRWTPNHIKRLFPIVN